MHKYQIWAEQGLNAQALQSQRILIGCFYPSSAEKNGNYRYCFWLRFIIIFTRISKTWINLPLSISIHLDEVSWSMQPPCCHNHSWKKKKNHREEPQGPRDCCLKVNESLKISDHLTKARLVLVVKCHVALFPKKRNNYEWIIYDILQKK